MINKLFSINIFAASADYFDKLELANDIAATITSLSVFILKTLVILLQISKAIKLSIATGAMNPILNKLDVII